MSKYKESKPLDKEESRLDIRHIPFAGGGAPIIGLLGGSKEDQVEANWDAWKLTGGTVAGAAGGSALGGAIGAGIGHLLGSVPATHNGIAIGSIAGGIAGTLLGNYLTFKNMAKNRNVDDDYDVRHFPLWGEAAQLAALQGYSPEDQVESNWNRLKMGVPALIAGNLSNMVLPGSSWLTSPATAMGMYNTLRKNRLEDNK